jgi:ribosomal protein S18 acetylase RimI-like enzyme
MSRYEVRALTSDDFPALRALEADVFGAAGEEVLCPYYLRLCTEFFPSDSFIASADGRAVGYLLSFVRGREAYCTTLAVRPELRATRVTIQLIGAFIRSVIDRCDTCWFTVKPDNVQARALHKMLGASDVGVRTDFYGPGDQRIISVIDRAALERMRPKYERLGLLERKVVTEAAA